MQKENLTTETQMGMRFYKNQSGLYFPSITTVLGKTSPKEKQESLENWRQNVGVEQADQITKHSADTGTAMHLLAERHMLKQPLQLEEFTEEQRRKYFGIRSYLNKIDLVASEVAVYSKELGVAGRCDCIGFYNGKLSIIDFKTSRKMKQEKDILDYKLQCCFYGCASDEMNLTTTDQGVVIMSSEQGFPQVFTFELPKYKERLVSRIDQFYLSLKI